jgi:hypothetical protein
MIQCDRCERILDAKDEGLEGIFGEDSPHEYLCPYCVENIAIDMDVEWGTTWDNNEAIINEWRRRVEQYRRQHEHRLRPSAIDSGHG